jgi:hypothetical protein
MLQQDVVAVRFISPRSLELPSTPDDGTAHIELGPCNIKDLV